METSPWHSLGFRRSIAGPVSSSRMTDGEVPTRLEQHGRNEVLRRKPVSPWRLFFSRSPLFHSGPALCRPPGIAVSFLPGESGRRLTGWFIIGIIVFSVALSFFEEYRSQKELEALDRLLDLRRLSCGRYTPPDRCCEVVPGDILMLMQGKGARRRPPDRRQQPAHGRIAPHR